ncbi:MAPK-activated protein kinase Srk1 [Dispira simplex]|nr:MAPK-activated protein kinase Srk1 [Dispira simplex]
MATMFNTRSTPQAAANKSRATASADRFQLLERMGDGAFSVVYKAYDRQLGKHVAIKVARKYQMKPSQRLSIYKEVSIMRSLSHSNVISLLDFRESNDYFYLIMDLVSGGELFNRIVELTYFSEPLARHVILQVAEAIRYLHNERGVIHRDIKPENILFEPIPYIPDPTFVSSAANRGKKDEGIFVEGVGGGGIGRVRLADFGLSKVIWNEPTLTPCGTVGYTAPEIVNDQKYSTGVDMWALGCVLYTMLCGFPPFYDEDVQVLTQKVACGYYTFLSPWWDNISESAKDLISNLLTVSPESRYSIDEFLAHPWCNTQLDSDMEGVETFSATAVSSDSSAPVSPLSVTSSSTATGETVNTRLEATAVAVLSSVAESGDSSFSPQTKIHPSSHVNVDTVDTIHRTAEPRRRHDSALDDELMDDASLTKPSVAVGGKREHNTLPKSRVSDHPHRNLRINLRSLGLDPRTPGLGSTVLFTPGGRQRVMAKTPITPVLTLKEAFDVSYAVRRVEHQENARRHPITPLVAPPSAVPEGGNQVTKPSQAIGGGPAEPTFETRTGTDTVLASFTHPLFSPQILSEPLDDDRRLIQVLFQRNADRLVNTFTQSTQTGGPVVIPTLLPTTPPADSPTSAGDGKPGTQGVIPGLGDLCLADNLPGHQAGLHMSPQSSAHSSSSEPPIFELDINRSTLLTKRLKQLKKVPVLT